jgi:hypothetical protein
MDQFFIKELQRMPPADLQLSYEEDELQVAYETCEAMFAREFEHFMGKLGAVPLENE